MCNMGGILKKSVVTVKKVSLQNCYTARVNKALIWDGVCDWLRDEANNRVVV